MKVLHSYKEYFDYKLDFLNKHGDWSVETSPMNEYGEWHKAYICTDEATFYENMRPVYKDAEVVVCGVTIPVKVKLLETEMYNSDDAGSVYYYEKYHHEKEAEI